MKQSIDLNEDAVYIVCNGELKTIKPPFHGDIVIKMVQGQAKKYDIKESNLL